MIPQVNPGAYFKSHREAVLSAITRVLDSGWYILGQEVRAFEQRFAQTLGLADSVGVATGTDALILALKALNIGPGDRVATVSHTATATVAAIHAVGAQPVWVDIEPEHYTMCPASLSQALATQAPVAALVIVHLYGQAANLPELLRLADLHGVPVVEDCAQAHGASFQGKPLGSWGKLSCFSFYPTKNLGAFGDGGLVASADGSHTERLRSLREYGWRQRYISAEPGMNSRLDELHAAVLSVRLADLQTDNQRRQHIAQLYRQGLSHAQPLLPAVRPGADHVYHQFVLRHPERDRVHEHMGRLGVACGIHYPVPVHLQPGYALGHLPEGGLPETERAAKEVLSLPMFAELSDTNVARVLDALGQCL
jgi:dTDP-4-amino-4,6-dideoxygalactose transaminase